MHIAPINPGQAALIRPNRSNTVPGRLAPMGHGIRGGQPRFGFIAEIILLSIPVSMIGGIIGTAIVQETKWNKTRQQLNHWLEQAKLQSVRRLSKPEIQQQDGKLVKRYDVCIGSQKFVVTEVYQENKQEGFLSNPKPPVMHSFKLEAVKGSLKTSGKPIIKFDLEPGEKNRKVKVVRYTDHFGSYETQRKGLVKKVEALIQVLHEHNAETHLGHILEGKAALLEQQAHTSPAPELEKTTPLDMALLDQDILEILKDAVPPPLNENPEASLYHLDIFGEDSELQQALEKYGEAPKKTMKRNR